MTLIIFNGIIKYSIKYMFGMNKDNNRHFFLFLQVSRLNKPCLLLYLCFFFLILILLSRFCSTFEVEFDIYGEAIRRRTIKIDLNVSQLLKAILKLISFFVLVQKSSRWQYKSNNKNCIKRKPSRS